MENIKVPATILEYKTGTFQGTAYASILARVDKKVLKFKVDIKQCPDLTDNVDEDTNLLIEIVPGSNLIATPKVVGIEE